MSKAGLPIIRLNKDGFFDALRPGKAVVEERFGTAAENITIIVDSSDH
jgi:hypothetical protein